MKSKVENQKSILVIQSMGFGDLLFALPVLRVIKRHYPNDPIRFVTSYQNSDLLSIFPEVTEVISYQSKTSFALMQLIRRVRNQTYRMAVVLNPIFRGSILAWCSGAPIRIGYAQDYEHRQSLWGLQNWFLTHSYKPREEKLHEVERYLDLLRMFGFIVHDEEKVPRLDLDEEMHEFGRTMVQELKSGHRGPLVVINPSAGWKLRDWPRERFQELADWLAAFYDAQIVFVGAERDRDLIDWILKGMRYDGRSYAGKITLSQLAGLLSKCDLFVTNDTGPLHLAAVLNIPTIALFGPGDPIKCRPLSPSVTVLYHQMPCAPCQFQYTNRCQNNLCMKEISVDEAKAAVSKVFGQRFASKNISHAMESPKKHEEPIRNVLYLQSTSEISGTEWTLLRTLEILDRRRFEPHVVFPHEGPLVEAFRKADCHVHIIPAMRKLTSREGIGYLFRLVIGYFPAVFQQSRSN